uniref:Uncharacterized protein n=1 Tax=Anguilla anguilla TaxID=7936 RepID=A0A0E9VKC3_ANGAN
MIPCLYLFFKNTLFFNTSIVQKTGAIYNSKTLAVVTLTGRMSDSFN